MGRAAAELNAYYKGVSLGFFEPTPKEVREKRLAMRPKQAITVALLHHAVVAVHTKEGLRAMSHEKPIEPASVDRYLLSKFGDRYKAGSDAMTCLAKSMTASELARRGYSLYEQFRPAVPAGVKAGAPCGSWT